jgi:hypothetical protein
LCLVFITCCCGQVSQAVWISYSCPGFLKHVCALRHTGQGSTLSRYCVHKCVWISTPSVPSPNRNEPQPTLVQT